MLTMPRFISRILLRRPPSNNAQEECEDRSNSSINNSKLNIPNSTLSTGSLHQNNTNARTEPRCSGTFERNVFERTKSLYLPSKHKQRRARMVCINAEQGTVHMEMIEQDLPSIASL